MFKGNTQCMLMIILRTRKLHLNCQLSQFPLIFLINNVIQRKCCFDLWLEIQADNERPMLRKLMIACKYRSADPRIAQRMNINWTSYNWLIGRTFRVQIYVAFDTFVVELAPLGPRAANSRCRRTTWSIGIVASCLTFYTFDHEWSIHETEGKR